MFDKTEPEKKISKGKKRAGEKAGEYQKGEFISLDDLVYAPLYALAKSNRQLRNYVVEVIQSMGTTRQEGQNEIVQLNNMNIAYDQIRPEGEGYSVDNLQLQVPLLSIVPVTNMNVKRAEIGFSTEVQVVKEDHGGYKINGRICSPEQRNSDFLPRVSYKMIVNSIDATEALLRLTDMLSTNQVVKKLDATPVEADGIPTTEIQKEKQQSLAEMQQKVKKLKQLYKKVSDMIAEQEKLYEIGKDTCEEDTYAFDREKFTQAQSHIMNKIMALKEKIVAEEVENEL